MAATCMANRGISARSEEDQQVQDGDLGSTKGSGDQGVWGSKNGYW